jgi:hypothetical protein
MKDRLAAFDDEWREASAALAARDQGLQTVDWNRMRAAIRALAEVARARSGPCWREVVGLPSRPDPRTDCSTSERHRRKPTRFIALNSTMKLAGNWTRRSIIRVRCINTWTHCGTTGCSPCALWVPRIRFALGDGLDRLLK